MYLQAVTIGDKVQSPTCRYVLVSLFVGQSLIMIQDMPHIFGSPRLQWTDRGTGTFPHKSVLWASRCITPT